MISVGIDIGSFSIKVAAVKPAGRGYEVIKLDEYPLSQDPAKDRTIEIVEALRDVRARYGTVDVRYTALAPQDRVSLRRRTFPFRERHKISKSLPFELEDDIPLSIENSVYDFKVTHYVGNLSHVIAAACPKEQIGSILEQLNDVQISPDIVSVEGIALGNVFEVWRDAPLEYSAKDQEVPEIKPADVVLHIGHSHTLVLVFQDGYLLDLREVDWGGRELGELIAQKYALHYVEALKELRKKAFVLTSNEGATREQIALSEIIKSGIDRLAHEVRLVLLELKSHYPIQYQSCVTSGGVALIRNLGPYLTQKLELPVNRLSSLEMMPEMNFSASPNNEIAFLTAIGAAVEGIRRPKNPPVNLLKGEFAKQSEAFRQFWEKWRIATQTAVALFLIVFVWAFLRESFTFDMSEQASDKLVQLARTIVQSKSRHESAARNFIREQERKERLKEVFDRLQEINSPLDILKSVTQVAPARTAGGLNVTFFSVENDTVRIAGEARNTEVVTRLLSALKGIAVNGDVTIEKKLPTAKPGYTPFAYTFKVQRRAG